MSVLSSVGVRVGGSIGRGAGVRLPGGASGMNGLSPISSSAAIVFPTTATPSPSTSFPSGAHPKISLAETRSVARMPDRHYGASPDGGSSGGDARPTPALAAAWRRARLAALALVSEAASRDWRAPPRPWADFFARASMPRRRSVAAWADRVALNSHLYQGNYCVAFGIALVLYVLRQPWSVFVVAALTVVGVRATSPEPIILRGRRITRRERLAAAFMFSSFLLLITGLMPSFILLVLGTSAFMTVHASLRHSHVRAHLGDIGIQKDDW